MADWAILDLLGSCQQEALHLELRDAYGVDDPVFADWRAGVAFDPAQRWAEWFSLICRTVGRGVSVRRARVVSEPVTEYIRFEHAITAGLNIASGEQVRWLPRRRAADLLLPGCDFWLFDASVVVFNHFTGDGTWDSEPEERRDDPELAAQCVAAFEAVWQRAVPHGQYQPV